jgi:hypothetical protein
MQYIFISLYFIKRHNFISLRNYDLCFNALRCAEKMKLLYYFICVCVCVCVSMLLLARIKHEQRVNIYLRKIAEIT